MDITKTTSVDELLFYHSESVSGECDILTMFHHYVTKNELGLRTKWWFVTASQDKVGSSNKNDYEITCQYVSKLCGEIETFYSTCENCQCYLFNDGAAVIKSKLLALQNEPTSTALLDDLGSAILALHLVNHPTH